MPHHRTFSRRATRHRPAWSNRAQHLFGATEALTRWAYSRLLRLSLEEIYEDQPDLRPSPDDVRALADRLGVSLGRSSGEAA